MPTTISQVKDLKPGQTIRYTTFGGTVVEGVIEHATVIDDYHHVEIILTDHYPTLFLSHEEVYVNNPEQDTNE